MIVSRESDSENDLLRFLMNGINIHMKIHIHYTCCETRINAKFMLMQTRRGSHAEFMFIPKLHELHNIENKATE